MTRTGLPIAAYLAALVALAIVAAFIAVVSIVLFLPPRPPDVMRADIAADYFSAGYDHMIADNRPIDDEMDWEVRRTPPKVENPQSIMRPTQHMLAGRLQLHPDQVLIGAAKIARSDVMVFRVQEAERHDRHAQEVAREALREARRRERERERRAQELERHQEERERAQEEREQALEERARTEEERAHLEEQHARNQEERERMQAQRERAQEARQAAQEARERDRERIREARDRAREIQRERERRARANGDADHDPEINVEVDEEAIEAQVEAQMRAYEFHVQQIEPPTAPTPPTSVTPMTPPNLATVRPPTPPAAPATPAARADLADVPEPPEPPEAPLFVPAPAGVALIAGFEFAAQLPDGRWLVMRQGRNWAELGWIFRTVLIIGGALVAVSLLSLLFARRLTQPIRNFSDAVQAVGVNPQSEPVQEEGPSELRGAARAVNTMQARLRALIADRTKTLAAVAHDMRTPLMRLRLQAENVAPEQREKMAKEIEEVEALVASFIAFARDDPAEEARVRLDLAALLQSVADDHAEAGRDVTYVGDERAIITGQSLGLKRVFTNLVDNALKYGERARITLTLLDGVVVVDVEDEGPGIPADQRESVFEPFVRLNEEGTRGAGLGLAAARSIARAHGGDIKILDAEKGAKIRVTLPG